MVNKINDLSRLCIHTMTTKPWDIGMCVKNYVAAGIQGITLWRNVLEGKKLSDIRRLLEDYGMKAVSLCRGGFFASADPALRELSVADNLFAIEQAAALGIPLIVLVCGSDRRQSLQKSREQIAEGILRVLPAAESAGIKLAIEPLHPMFAGDRSAVNTMKQANDLAELINSESVGVAVDVYHTWWDDSLQSEICRSAATNRLFAFHICDWNIPTIDMLNDRGLMGDGCIDIPLIRSWMEDSGFTGFHEVEIFSNKFWSLDQKEYLYKIINAYLNHS